MQACERAVLTNAGVVENRRFYLVDGQGRMVNAKRLGNLVQVRADYDASGERLALTFPDGSVVEGAATAPAGSTPVTTSFFGRLVTGRELGETFDGPLSAHAGRPLRLLRTDRDGTGVDRGRRSAVSILGEASLGRLGAELGLDGLPDPRRFRMLFGIAGTDAHEEDAWVGRRVALGAAVVAVRGLVGRCIVTTRSPESGEVDLETLAALRRYRTPESGEGSPPFGVHGEVVVPGTVSVGDPVSLDGS